MIDFKIIDIFEHYFCLIVLAEHYHADGGFWFRENYRWLGSEGLIQKRATDSEGRPLLDNGELAPTRPADNHRPEEVAYLPSGRDWARLPAPHVDEGSILDTIRSIHAQRLVTGFPQGTIDRVSAIPDSKITQRDRDGCPVLIAKFAYLKGRAI